MTKGKLNPADVPVRVGQRWVWEIDKPLAIAVVEVIDLKEGAEEWSVKTRTLLGTKKLYSKEIDRESEQWNTFDRFLEACSPVEKPGGRS